MNNKVEEMIKEVKMEWEKIFKDLLDNQGFATASGLAHFENKGESFDAAQKLVGSGYAIWGEQMDIKLKNYLLRKEITSLKHYPIALLQEVGLIRPKIRVGGEVIVVVETKSVWGSPVEMKCIIHKILPDTYEVVQVGCNTVFYVAKENTYVDRVDIELAGR